MNQLRQILRDQSLLNIARLLLRSRSNGPGLRAVIWLQGCSILCPGCINQDFLPFIKQTIVRPKDLLRQIHVYASEVEGITVSGGEPFDQVEGLILLVKEAKEMGLSSLVYTGYSLESLYSRNDWPLIEVILKNIDILIDGPFLTRQRGNFLGRGSGNQIIHFLSERYDASVLEHPSSWFHEEMVLRDDEQLIRTGILKAQVP